MISGVDKFKKALACRSQFEKIEQGTALAEIIQMMSAVFLWFISESITFMARHIDSLRHAFDCHYAKKVAFRPFARADGFPLFEATRHPEFNRNLLWTAPETEQGIFQQVDKLVREHTLGRALILSICQRQTGEWQGLLRIEDYEDGVEIGLYLHPDSWSRGVVVVAGSAFIELIFRSNPALPMYIRMLPSNERLLRICKVYNFEFVREETDHHPITGQKQVHVYRLTKDRWPGFQKLTHF